MTKEGYIYEMRNLLEQAIYNPSDARIEADDLIVTLLEDLGYEEVANLFQEIRSKTAYQLKIMVGKPRKNINASRLFLFSFTFIKLYLQ